MKTLLAIVQSPKTSVPGFVMILGSAGMILQDWKALFDAQRNQVIVGGLVAGVGLLLAAQVNAASGPKPEPPSSDAQ